jgi:magnesium transporter
MTMTLTGAHGVTEGASASDVDEALGGHDFFWLDIDSGGGTAERDETTDLLLHHFRFHPLAVEDADQFGRRPKIEDYDDVVYMVAHGARGAGHVGTVEVHLFMSERFVVTVHRGSCPVLAEVRERRTTHHAANTDAPPHLVLMYLVVDGLTESFFPVLSAMDDKIDSLEDEILQTPTEAQLGEIFDMKRQLVAIRKVVAPQRDMFAELTSGLTDVPGMTDEGSRYFRNLYDHLIRIGDMVDNYRDLLSGVMDTHISTVSNRLNVVMKQLTIIATIFLPLSFLTGFFGQNFAFLVRNIQDAWAFWAFGIGIEVAAVAVLLAIFVRRGWLGGPSA